MQQGPKLWKYVVIPLGIGILVFAIFGGVAYYLMNGSKTSRYNQAVNAYTAGNYKEAAEQFEKLGDYRDSKQRSSESLTLMHYNNGKLAFQSGEYARAKEEYQAAGDYENAKLLAEECDRASHYANGESLASSGDTDKAIEEFKKSEYKDYKDRIAALYVTKSDKALAEGKYDQALEFAKTAADYKDTNEPVLSCYYNMGEDAFSKNDLNNAVANFTKAGEFKDAADKAKSINYTLGTDALNKKDYENAAEYLKLAGDFRDASTIAKEAFYVTATKRYNEKNYAAASEYFKLAGEYKNSKTLYQASCYNLGTEELKAGKFEDAAGHFELCGSYKYAKDLVNVCIGEAAIAANKLSDAMSAYKKVSKKASVSGFNIQSRKTFVTNWYNIDKICRDYGITSQWIHSERKTGYVRHFAHITTFVTSQAVSLRYSVNANGTFNVTGAATWGRLLNCPNRREDIRMEVVLSRFQFAGIKKFPSSIKLSGGAKLTYKNGTMTIKYNKKKGRVRYTTNNTYR